MAEPTGQSELMAELMQRMASGQVPDDVPALRRMLDDFAPLLNMDPPDIGAIHEDVLLREVGGARVCADVLVPSGAGPHPVLVYLHGGGWVAGSPRTHRKLGLRFAEAGHLVVNVDYRLAPEAPFPAPFEDCVFAVRWAVQNASPPQRAGSPSAGTPRAATSRPRWRRISGPTRARRGSGRRS